VPLSPPPLAVTLQRPDQNASRRVIIGWVGRVGCNEPLLARPLYFDRSSRLAVRIGVESDGHWRPHHCRLTRYLTLSSHHLTFSVYLRRRTSSLRLTRAVGLDGSKRGIEAEHNLLDPPALYKEILDFTWPLSIDNSTSLRISPLKRPVINYACHISRVVSAAIVGLPHREGWEFPRPLRRYFPDTPPMRDSPSCMSDFGR
jgi:hypothetical protein